MRRKLLGAEHLDVADSMDDLGKSLLDRGNFAEAEPLLREALALRRRLLGEEHKEVASSLQWSGALIEQSGQICGSRRVVPAGAGDAPQTQRRGASARRCGPEQPGRDVAGTGGLQRR